MSSVQFYHLLTTPLEVALPKLAAMAYSRDMRTCIVADANRLPALDKILWTYDPSSFLPHAIVGAGADQQQPILLANQPMSDNNASLWMITNGIMLEDIPQQVEKVFDIFNGHDAAAVQAARTRWKTYHEKSWKLTYIKQRDDGGWDKLKET